MADSGWGCKSNGANPRWGCKSNFDGAVSPMGRYVHTNWGAQYRGAVSPASGQRSSCLVLSFVLSYVLASTHMESNGQGWGAWSSLVEMC